MPRDNSPGTRVYGASHCLVTFEGDVSGEVLGYRTDDRARGVRIVCDDGTIFGVKYSGSRGIWEIVYLKAGALFEKIVRCRDPRAEPYSDVAHLLPGVKAAWTATEWESVQ